VKQVKEHKPKIKIHLFQKLKPIHNFENMKKEDNNLFLKKEIQNPDIINQTSDLIDQWEARLPYSPIGTFSQDTTFVKLVDHACLRIEVISQVVYRSLQRNHFPDDGENCPEIPDDLNSFDIWKQECQMNLDFEEHRNSFTINETRERLICDKCKAKGVLNCLSCDGTGKVNCENCGGSGQVTVRNTNGGWLGMKNCSNCHGSGQTKCKRCNQGLANCDKCNGITKIIRCSSIEQIESPIKEEMIYISSELPVFKSENYSPLHDLKGVLSFTQNDMQIIASLECPHEEINKIVWNKLTDYLKNNERMFNKIYSPRLDYTYYLIQIADEDVDVIAHFIHDQNSLVSQNDRFSLIRWGSQVDLVLPLDKRYNFELIHSDTTHVEAGVDKLIKLIYK
jgi:hypothetical protein